MPEQDRYFSKYSPSANIEVNAGPLAMPEAFGVGMTRGLQQEFKEFGDVLDTREKRESALWTSSTMSEARKFWLNRLEEDERSKNAGPGYAQSIDKEYKKYMNGLLKN